MSNVEGSLIEPSGRLVSIVIEISYLWSQDALDAACLYAEEGRGEELALHEPLPDGRGADR